MAIDWSVVGAGIGMAFTGLISWFTGRKVEKAKNSATAAASGADRSISQAEQTLYTQLRGRMEDLEGDVRKLRKELNEERRKGHDLEMHIWKLERVMREANLSIPPFVSSLTLKE